MDLFHAEGMYEWCVYLIMHVFTYTIPTLNTNEVHKNNKGPVHCVKNYA